LVGIDRVCLGYTAGGRAPALQGVAGYQLQWIGSVVPWWLMPLRVIAAADRSLFEVMDGAGVAGFVAGADPCFSVELYSCPRSILPAVVAHMRKAGVMGNPGEVIDQDATYFELQVDCDGGSHATWQVAARHGSACPDDLASIDQWIDDDAGLDDAQPRGESRCGRTRS
jgi:hypothetical protein